MSLGIDIGTPFNQGQQNGLIVHSCCPVQGGVAESIWYICRRQDQENNFKMLYCFFWLGGRQANRHNESRG